MASSMISSAAIASVSSVSPAQNSMVAPFTGLKSSSAFPEGQQGHYLLGQQWWKSSMLSEGKKFETLSYLPPLTSEQLAKEVEYLLRKGWVPCLEFEFKHGFVSRENHSSPGYYDGRYWTMWKLPMFGCTDSSQVLKELEEAKKEYPDAFIRIIGFDNVRQVQCISFIAYKPPRFEESNA